MMRRSFPALVGSVIVAGAWVAAVPPAASAASPCRVVNTAAGRGQIYHSLQAAVQHAAAKNTLSVKGTCTGTTVIDQTLTISGQGKNATLNGGRAGSVLDIGLTGVSVTLNRLNITNGTGSPACATCSAINGGGIVNSGALTLNDTTVRNNTTGSAGGGIFNAGTVTLNDSTVSNNTATDHRGGGGGIRNYGTLIMNGDSTVCNNTTGLDGGGIYNTEGTLIMNGSSTVANNTAARDGGGIYNTEIAPGGVYNTESTVTMTGSSTVRNNTAGRHGGGIYNNSALVGAVAGESVLNNDPDDIFSV
jgi:hypothetical protein